MAAESSTERRILVTSMRQGLRTQPALLVRGSSRRITIMRFRPANIRVINRRDDRLGRRPHCFPLAREEQRKPTPRMFLTRSSISEEQLQRELYDTRRHRTAGDRSKRAEGTKIVRGRIELSVVPDVVKLCPEFRIQRFRDFRVLDYRKIPVVLAGAHNCAHPRVSETYAATGPSAVTLDGASDARRGRVSGMVNPSIAAGEAAEHAGIVAAASGYADRPSCIEKNAMIPVSFGPVTVKASCIGAAHYRKVTSRRRKLEWPSTCSKTVL
jgi:hypothetical protein